MLYLILKDEAADPETPTTEVMIEFLNEIQQIFPVSWVSGMLGPAPVALAIFCNSFMILFRLGSISQ